MSKLVVVLGVSRIKVSEVVAPAAVIEQAMPPSDVEPWEGAVWIGVVDGHEFLRGAQSLPPLIGYRRVRLLVRTGRYARGFVDQAVDEHGGYDHQAMVDAITALPDAHPRPADRLPAVSIVLCTYDRPTLLQEALRTLIDLDYPDFEIVVVDNNPSSGLTPPVVDLHRDPRIRLVNAPTAGLARARNRGALAARNPVVAFTDDDVVVDPQWLQGIADGFAAGTDVCCVCGIVPTGEIRSAAQAYFDERVSWARSCAPDVFALSQSRPDEPMFPFQVSRFGTGANFAMSRSTILELGGFDEGLGIGSKAGGGEDIDMFVRVLLAGHELAYEPAALVWHKHRTDLASLRKQITDYGTGLGAWLTKLLLHPRTLAMIVKRIGAGISHLRQVTQLDSPIAGWSPELASLWRVERRGVFMGPLALARSRLSGARGQPLSNRSTPLPATTSTPPSEEI